MACTLVRFRDSSTSNSIHAPRSRTHMVTAHVQVQVRRERSLLCLLWQRRRTGRTPRGLQRQRGGSRGGGGGRGYMPGQGAGSAWDRSSSKAGSADRSCLQGPLCIILVHSTALRLKIASAATHNGSRRKGRRLAIARLQPTQTLFPTCLLGNSGHWR